MSTVIEIEEAIEKLPPEERKELERRVLERKAKQETVFQKLRALAGTARDLPADLALNHDHYLHGAPKRPTE